MFDKFAEINEMWISNHSNKLWLNLCLGYLGRITYENAIIFVKILML